MLSRTGVSLFCLGFTVGVIAFGCASASRREPASMARAHAQPSAVSPPTPAPAVQPASWAPADAPASPMSRDREGAESPALPNGRGSSGPMSRDRQGAESVESVKSLPLPDGPGSSKVRELYRQAVASYAGIDSYFARLRRREEVAGQPKPEELLLFKFRKQPWSVYFKWLGPEAVGREATFVKGRYDSKLHTLLAAGDMPFMRAGTCIALDPESVLVRSRSRHAVTEAGVGHVIEKMGKQLQAEDEHQKVLPLRYLGPVRRPEYVAPLEAVEQIIPPDGEAGPDGGNRQIFFDPATHLPVLLVMQTAKGHELEYYCYDRLQYPVKLDDDDFNPDKLWKKKEPRPSGSGQAAP